MEISHGEEFKGIIEQLKERGELKIADAVQKIADPVIEQERIEKKDW